MIAPPQKRPLGLLLYYYYYNIYIYIYIEREREREMTVIPAVNLLIQLIDNPLEFL